MVVAQTARGPVESQHTRGLTIQLSQGQGRQPLRPEGRFRPRVCCAHKLLLPAMVVRRWQDKTPERCVFRCWVSVPSLEMALAIGAPLDLSNATPTDLTALVRAYQRFLTTPGPPSSPGTAPHASAIITPTPCGPTKP